MIKRLREIFLTYKGRIGNGKGVISDDTLAKEYNNQDKIGAQMKFKKTLIGISLIVISNAVAFPAYKFYGANALPLLVPTVLVNRFLTVPVYAVFPAVVGFGEHLTGWDFPQAGRCRIDNVTPLVDGVLISGDYMLPTGKKVKHVQAITSEGKIIENTCPECSLQAIDSVVVVQNKHIIARAFSEVAGFFQRRTAGYFSGALLADRLLL